MFLRRYIDAYSPRMLIIDTMMAGISSKRLKIGKTVVTRLLAAFFLFYALADVSILQAYCGNEAVGIPPAHHQKESNDVITEASSSSTSDSVEVSRGSSSESDPRCCTDECFCCCPHVTTPMRITASKISPVVSITSKPEFELDPLITGDGSKLFHPPKLA